MKSKQDDDRYGDDEVQQRFEKLVRRALKTPPKTLKSMGRKGMPSQSKKGRKAAATRRKKPHRAA